MTAHVEFPEIGDEIPYETYCLLCKSEHMSNEPCQTLLAMAGRTCQQCGHTCHEVRCHCEVESNA